MQKTGALKISVTIVTALFIFLAIAFYMNFSWRIFKDQAYNTIQNKAAESARTVDTSINYALNSIKLISQFTTAHMTERELKNPNYIFSEFDNEVPFDFIEYIRWDGINMMNGIENGEPFDASDRYYYKEGIRGNTGFWINFSPKAINDVLVNFYTPLMYDKTVVGVLTGAIIGSSGVEPMLSASFFGQPLVGFLIDGNYTVIASNDTDLVSGMNLFNYPKSNVLSDIIRHCSRYDTTPFPYIYNGREGACCIAPVENTDWFVVMMLMPRTLKASQSEINRNMVIVLSFIISLLFIYSMVQIYITNKSNKKVEERLYRTATRDSLTGLLNRYAYQEAIRNLNEEELDADLVYVAMDVNGLKAANDTFGHGAGDELLKGAASCISLCFGPFGKVYRTGGDEFQVIMHVSEKKLEEVKKNFMEAMENWQGEFVKELTISAGYVLAKEFNGKTIFEISKIADQRMYTEKSLHYSLKGVDRRTQQAAYDMLCRSYEKILKVNLTKDEYSVIQLSEGEKSPSLGYNEKISLWLRDFCESGGVYEDDKREFAEKTSLKYLASYFADGNVHFSLHYRRLIDGVYKNAMMEMIPAQDYSSENQVVFLYVKNIEKRSLKLNN